MPFIRPCKGVFLPPDFRLSLSQASADTESLGFLSAKSHFRTVLSVEHLAVRFSYQTFTKDLENRSLGRWNTVAYGTEGSQAVTAGLDRVCVALLKEFCPQPNSSVLSYGTAGGFTARLWLILEAGEHSLFPSVANKAEARSVVSRDCGLRDSSLRVTYAQQRRSFWSVFLQTEGTGSRLPYGCSSLMSPIAIFL